MGRTQFGNGAPGSRHNNYAIANVERRSYVKTNKRNPDLYRTCVWHYGEVILSAMASQITSLTIVYSTIYSGADLRKHQSSASLAFVRGIHRWPVNSPPKGPVTRKMFPFDDVIMSCKYIYCGYMYFEENLALVRVKTTFIKNKQ